MIQIERLASGMLRIVKDDEVIEKATLVRLFPYQYETKYIAILNEKNEEIMILTDVEELESTSKKVAVEYLRYKYYMPEITKVNDVSEKMGFLYIKVDTTAGKKEVCIADFTSNIRVIQNKILSVTDIEGNKYRVNDLNALDTTSRQKIDVFL